jgi:hypothetical protein
MPDVMQPLTETEAALVVSRRDFGFAGLRMLPKKEKGVRLITNMSRRTRSKAVRVKNKTMLKKKLTHADILSAVPATDQPKPAEGDKVHMSAKVADTSAMGTHSNAGGRQPIGANGTNVQYKRDRPRSINDALIDAFLVLKHEKLNNPACWGASVRILCVPSYAVLAYRAIYGYVAHGTGVVQY